MQEKARCLCILYLRRLRENRVVQWWSGDIVAGRMPNAVEEWKCRAKTGFRGSVERVGNDTSLVVLPGRRIKGQIEIGVFLRRNLNSELVGFLERA